MSRAQKIRYSGRSREGRWLRSPWGMTVFALVMLALGFLAGFFTRSLMQPPTIDNGAVGAPTPMTIDPAVVQQVTAETRHFKGDPNAPVTMIEFSDFQCPFCGNYANNIGPQVDQAYVDSGQVRVGYFHYPFLGEESFWAAEASECAADQGAFWEYHDKLFDVQSGENQGAFSQENLKRFAEEIGLDSAAFNECFDSGRYTELVEQQAQLSASIGIASTPSFYINDALLEGAEPFATFSQMIEQQLP